MTSMTRAEIGALGEQLAVEHMATVGLRALVRNWRCRYGELDVIAEDAATGTVVFVEVKTRTGDGYGGLAEAVPAQKVRRLISQDFGQAFRACDVIMGPIAPTTAFPIGEKVADPVQMYLGDIFTVPASLAGLPAMSVPSIFRSPEARVRLAGVPATASAPATLPVTNAASVPPIVMALAEPVAAVVMVKPSVPLAATV